MQTRAIICLYPWERRRRSFSCRTSGRRPLRQEARLQLDRAVAISLDCKRPIAQVSDARVIEAEYLHLVIAAVAERRGDGPVETAVVGCGSGNDCSQSGALEEPDFDVARDVVRPGDSLGSA